MLKCVDDSAAYSLVYLHLMLKRGDYRAACSLVCTLYCSVAIAVLRVRQVASDGETCCLLLKFIVDSVMSFESNELSARSWVAIILFISTL
jgi:hypothetical protein